MTDQNDCRFEADVLSATRTGAWTQELRAHVATCPACRDTIRVATALQEVAMEMLVPTSLPNHRLIWLKAQVLQKQERVARLELLGKLGACAAVFLAVAVIAVWSWLGSWSNQTGVSLVTDWEHTVKMAAPIVIALLVVYVVNNTRPVRRNRWI